LVIPILAKEWLELPPMASQGVVKQPQGQNEGGIARMRVGQTTTRPKYWFGHPQKAKAIFFIFLRVGLWSWLSHPETS
jgi:hypothetical protein